MRTKIIPEKVIDYLNNLKHDNLGSKTSLQKLESVDNFLHWACEKGYIDEAKLKQIEEILANFKLEFQPQAQAEALFKTAPLEANFLKKNWLNGILQKLPLLKEKRKGQREKIETGGADGRVPGSAQIISSTDGKEIRDRTRFRIPDRLGPQHYLGIAIILVLMAALGAGAYNQFFKKVETPFAFPSQLTKPSQRFLSFQGRLTDSLDNPIITATSVQFKLYNIKSGGEPLYSSGTCSITPDQDGIFNVLVGGSGLTTDQQVCGAGITQDVFQNSPNVYLGITIGSDTEATPRQQIANVGYAINSETLQGFPPGTGKSTIPYLNSDGDLLIATSGASIKSTWQSANFTLASASNLVLQSGNPTVGSGDIYLQATGSGNLQLRTGGATDSSTRLYIGNNGNVGIRNLLPTTALDVTGSGSFSGDLAVNGSDITTTGTGTANVFNFNATTVNIGGGVGAGGINLAGGSGSTGCSLDGTNGNLTCSGDITGAATGTVGYWTRSGTTLSPATTGDSVSITGNTTIGDASGDTLTANAASWTFVNDTNFVLSGGVNGLSFDTDTFSVDATGNLIGIGTTSPTSKLHVTGAVTGKALSIFDETGDQDIFTASASGAPKFTISRTGSLIFEGSTDDLNELTLAVSDPTADRTITVPVLGADANLAVYGGTLAAGDLLYGATTNVLTRLTIGGGGTCLTSNGSVPSWGSCSGSITLQAAYEAGNTISVTSTEGALSVDLVSANFDIEVGQGTDTGDFRIWDGTDNWLFVDESADTLALGAAAGGGVSLGATAVTTTSLGAFTVNGNTILGDASGDTLTSNAASWTFVNDTNFVLSGGVNGLSFDTDTFSVDATGDKVGIGTTAPVSKLHLTGAVTGKALAIFDETGDQAPFVASASGVPIFIVNQAAGTDANGFTFTSAAAGSGVTLAATGTDTNIALSLDSKGTGALNLNNSATGDVLLAGGSGSTGCTVTNSTGDFACSGDLAVNGADITTTSVGTATVFNTNATTLNIGGVATTVGIGASTGTTTVNNSLTATGVLTANNTSTFNSDVDFIFLETENFSTANTVTGSNSVDLVSSTLTNNSTSGTQRGLVINVAGSGVTENGALITRSGAGSGTTALEISGTWGTGILTSNNSINAGTGAITSGAINASGALTVSSGGAAITGNLSLDGDLSFVGAQTISTTTGNLTIDTAGTLVVSDAIDLNNSLDLDSSSTTALTVGDGSADTLTVNTSGDVVTIAGAISQTGGGASTFSGNVTLGDTSADTITFTGSQNSNLVPSADLTYDLGSATFRYNNIYAGTLHITSTDATGSTSDAFIINSDNTSADAEDSQLEYERGSVSPNAIIKWDSTNDEFDFNFPINITSTATQIKASYDSSNHFTAAVSSDGSTTFNATGTGADFTFSDAVIVSAGGLTVSTGGVTISAGGANITGGTSTDTLTVSSTATFNGISTFNTDVDFTFLETENFALTNTVSGTNSVDLINATLTNNTSSGTQRGLVLTLNGSGVTDVGELITYSGAGSGTTALEISGTWGTGILTNNNSINAGSGSITGGTGTFSSINLTGPLTITSTTTPQLSVRYDASNRYDASVSSTGAVTFDAFGSGAAFAFSDNLTSNANTTLGDTSGDSVTVNAATWTFANDTNFVLSGGVNGLSFDTDTFSVDATGDKVGIGTSAPVSKLHLTGAVTGKALAIFDETGDQAPFTASISGTPVFTIAHPAGTIVNGFTLTPSVSGSGVSLATSGTDTNINLALDAKGSGTVDIGAVSTGNILLGGGSGSTGCTVTNSNGNLTCSGDITGAATGTVGYWTRSGTTLSPATAGDSITTSGNISTSGSGTGTFAGLLTASNGLTLTTGALSLTSTSGTAALTLSSSTTAFNVQSGLFDIDTTNSKIGIGTTAPVAKLHLTGAVTGKALAIFDETGDQSPFTASAGGIPIFTIVQAAGTDANGFTFTSAAAGSGVSLAATGSDTNIALSIAAKGTGALNLNTTNTGAVAIGNATGTFSLTSSGGLNVTTGGALTGVASLDTITTSSTALTFTSTAPTISVSTAATNITLDAGTSGKVLIAQGSTGDVDIAGGSGATGCTITNSNGNLTCSGDITGAATGTVGYWTRSGTTLSPATAGDAITTSGNISTSGSGTGTFAGLLTASNGLTLTTGALTLTGTSGSIALTGFGTTSITSTTTTGNINTLADSSFAVAAAGTGNLANFTFTNGSTNTSGTSVTTGLNIAATNNAAGSGGIQETYGIRLQDIAGTAGAGTQNNYGIRIGNYGQSSSETSYGLYVDSQSGSTNSYSAIFAGGNVGIGTTAPSDKLHVDAGNILQTPSNPTYKGGGDLASYGSYVFISGRYAYVTKGGNAGTCNSSTNTGCELQIWDISDPTSPIFKGGADDGGSDNAKFVFVSGRYAYITKDSNTGTCSSSVNTGCEFQIYDISNPASPTYKGGADNGSGLFHWDWGVYVSGRYAYITRTANAGTCDSSTSTGCELQIWDISDPTSPIFKGGADIADQTNGVFIAGRFAYIVKVANAGTCNSSTSTGCELQIYDVSDPSSPTYKGGADVADQAVSVFASGRYAYLSKVGNAGTCNSSTSTGCELQIYDVSDPTAPTFKGGADDGGSDQADSVFVSGRYAYLAKYNNAGTCSSSTSTGCELQIYDVSDPTNPTFKGGVDDGGSDLTTSVFVSGRFAYITKNVNAGTCSSADSTGCEFQIYDISGIEATSVMAHSLEAGSLQVRDNAIINNQLYVQGGLGVGIGGIYSNGAITATNGLTVNGLQTGKALAIFNETGNQAILTASASGTTRMVLTNAGNLGLGTTSPSDRLHVYNGNILQTPSSPTYQGGADANGSTNSDTGSSQFNDVFVNGRYAYVVKNGDITACSQTPGSAIGCELQVYDVTIPGSPTYVGGVDVTGSATGIGSSTMTHIFISGRYAYIAKAANATACSQAAGSAIGCELQVYDVSNPSTPTYAGGIDSGGSLTGTINQAFNDVFVSGRYAYMVKSNSSTACSQTPGSANGCELQVYDVSNPSGIIFLGGNDVSGSPTGTGNEALSDIFVSGRYVYVDKGGNATQCSQTPGSAIGCELQVYDLSNPTTPTYVGGADASGTTNDGTTSSAMNDVFVSGRYAYISKAGSGTLCSQTPGSAVGCELQVYNITNPATPSYVGGADASGSTNSGTGSNSFTAIFVSGRYAFTANAQDATNCSSVAGSAIGCEYQTYDVSNPASPTFAGAVDISGAASGTGNQAYTGIFNNGRFTYLTKAADGTAACSQTAGSAAPCELQVYDISGVEATSVMAHSLEAGSLQVRGSASVFEQLSVGGGLNVGIGGVLSNGAITATNGLTVNGLQTGKALAVFNETGDQNIIVASASGVTQATLGRTGNLAIEGTISDLTDATLVVDDDLQINGNDILDSGAATRITLGATTTLTNTTTTLSGTTTLTASSLTTFTTGATLAFSGDIQVNGNDIKDSGGNTRITLSTSQPNVDITGTVQMTIEGDAAGVDALCGSTALNGDVGDTVDETILDCSGNPTSDYAEIYPTKNDVDYGDLVAVSNEIVKTKKVINNKVIEGEYTYVSKLEKSTSAYQDNIIGVTSNNYSDFSSTGHGVVDDSDHPLPVALNGRVPLKVTNENGSIKAGDFITSSSTPGYGMKATRSGRIIGVALENFEGAQGTVLVFINLSWYKPSVVEEFVNGLQDKTVQAEEFVSEKMIVVQVQAQNLTSQLIDATSVNVQNLTANIAQIPTLITDNISANQKIISPIVETDNLVVKQTAKINEVQTNIIKPQEKDLTIDLDSSVIASEAKQSDEEIASSSLDELGTPRNDTGQLAKLIIKGLQGKTAATIDAEGNATFSGQLTASSVVSDQLNTNEATIEGKLTAKEIESQTITELRDRLSTVANSTEETSQTTQKLTTDSQQLSSSINEVQTLLGQIRNSSLPDTTYYQNLPNEPITISGTVDSNNNLYLSQYNSLVLNNLSVSQSITATDIYAVNSLTSGSISIKNDQILSLTDELKLSALSSINLLDGAVIIGKDGTLTTKGQLIAKGGIKTNEIKSLSENTPVNINGAAIDASGSAYFNNLSANGLSVTKYLEATTSGSIVTAEDNLIENGINSPSIQTKAQIAGVALLPTGEKEIIIYNDTIKKDSLIYLTPTSQTANQISVTDKQDCSSVIANEVTQSDGEIASSSLDELGTPRNDSLTCRPYFKVSTGTSSHPEIKFNWLIIN